MTTCAIACAPPKFAENAVIRGVCDLAADVQQHVGKVVYTCEMGDKNGTGTNAEFAEAVRFTAR